MDKGRKGGPRERIRTYDLRIRSPTLYPAELRAVPRMAVLAVVTRPVQTSPHSLWFLVALQGTPVSAGAVSCEFIDVFLLLGRLHRLKTKEALLFKEPNDLFCERLLAHFIGGTKRLTATTHNETVDRFFLLALVPLSRCELIWLWV